MTIEELQQSGRLFEGWQVKRLIGAGSFGKVYEIERDEYGVKLTAALKIITVPKNFSDLIEIKNGDCFLLCSDGVTDVLEDEVIAAILSQNPTSEAAADALVAAALDRDSKDNCTALVARVRKKPVLLYSF